LVQIVKQFLSIAQLRPIGAPSNLGAIFFFLTLGDKSLDPLTFRNRGKCADALGGFLK
jgi:hypothetical protein